MSSVIPSRGSPTGFDTITIIGTDFHKSAVYRVAFGSTGQARSVKGNYINTTSIWCTTLDRGQPTGARQQDIYGINSYLHFDFYLFF